MVGEIRKVKKKEGNEKVGNVFSADFFMCTDTDIWI